VVLLLSLGCASSTGPTLGDQPLELSEPATVLGEGDVVEIHVFPDESLNGTYRLGRDAVIDFPLIGAVTVEGRSPRDVEQEIKARLADDYLVNPTVTVFVKEQNSLKVFVLGQVNRPGAFPFSNGMTVIEAITKAGGFTELASPNGTSVSRSRGPAGPSRIRVSVGDIQSGKASDFVLKPGDIITVPEAVF